MPNNREHDLVVQIKSIGKEDVDILLQLATYLAQTKDADEFRSCLKVV